MIYVASPYTDPDPEVMQRRYEAVCAFCADATHGYFPVFSPIAHWHPIAVRHELPRAHDFWIAIDNDYLAASKALVILRLPGWRESKGIRQEIREARLLGLRILEVDNADHFRQLMRAEWNRYSEWVDQDEDPGDGDTLTFAADYSFSLSNEKAPSE